MAKKELKKFIVLLLFLAVFISILIVGFFFFTLSANSQFQKSLQPFYSTPSAAEGELGDIVRYEPLNISIPNGTGYRILYVSQLSNGKKVVVSGMIFIPNNVSTVQRDIVAWAHGTVGMGRQCAPSRQKNPIAAIPWVSDMLSKGFVVVATDYYGLGTNGTMRYLIGQDEGRDVLNSVRAAQKFPNSHAGSKFALWGHSQGGHAVLFAANMAINYSPELHLVGVAAAAPAVELSSLMAQQYNKAVSWVIGPEIAVSWPIVYPNLSVSKIVSSQGLSTYKKIAYGCVVNEVGQATIREDFKENFFAIDPNENLVWKNALNEQSPLPVLQGVPVFIIQSLSDTVVFPNVTALYVKNSCEEGSKVSVQWLQNISHQDTAKKVGPEVTDWLSQRFYNELFSNNCDQILPIAPYR